MYKFFVLLAVAAANACAQEMEHMHDHEHMEMGNAQMQSMHHGSGGNSAQNFLMTFMAGTAANPAGWNMPMLMQGLGQGWQNMLMGQAFIVSTQQSGPRGGDKVYSPNWFMDMLSHPVGEHGAVQIQVMLSLDPATITNRRYPLLFQTGESAFGQPIMDGQHPHDLFMGLGLQYAYALRPHAIGYVSYSPVGDPALGPVAFPHRASAAEIPQATLGHHWQDSTHIAYNVITAGLAVDKLRFEASGFRGREPNENRWNIDFGPMDSWSGRVWYTPRPQWSIQASAGRLTRPEALEEGDVIRTTASAQYSKPFHKGFWSSSLIWGRNHRTATGTNTNSYVLESVAPVTRNNLITGRAELVDKDELEADEKHLPTARVGSYTLGYTRNIPFLRWLDAGIGANFTFYSLPDRLRPYYGDRPLGGNVFLRFRVKGSG